MGQPLEPSSLESEPPMSVKVLGVTLACAPLQVLRFCCPPQLEARGEPQAPALPGPLPRSAELRQVAWTFILPAKCGPGAQDCPWTAWVPGTLLLLEFQRHLPLL